MASHEETRLHRLGVIKQSILKSKKWNTDPQVKEKLIAMCSMEWGTSRRTILEYIKIVELTL